jgi:protein-serine/threonine kinase
VHASDADQAEALLTRWGPDGLGKLGGEHPSSRNPFAFSPPSFSSFLSDPHWAFPIKARIREVNQARAINEVVSALKPEQHRTANGEIAPLRVVNGISTQISSMITVSYLRSLRQQDVA